MVRAIVKITAAPSNAQISLARKGTDTTCQGCGMFGHDVYTSGCDKCAQYILIKRFLERHPDQISPLISKYQKHQSERAKSCQSRPDREKESFKENQKFKKTHRYPLRSNNKACVKKLLFWTSLPALMTNIVQSKKPLLMHWILLLNRHHHSTNDRLEIKLQLL